MKFWISSQIENNNLKSKHVDLGFFSQNVPPKNSSHAVLQIINDISKIEVLKSDIECWYVPLGYGLDLHLISELKKTKKPIFICINGLGNKSMDHLQRELETYASKFVLNSNCMSLKTYCDQLTWLNAQKFPFLVKSDDQTQLTIAISLSPEGLIITNLKSINMEELISQDNYSHQFSPRPFSTEEVDSVYLKEVGLIASRDLSAGSLLSEEDLTIGKSKERGLAPYLKSSVIGKILRYNLTKGNALTFGFIRND